MTVLQQDARGVISTLPHSAINLDFTVAWQFRHPRTEFVERKIEGSWNMAFLKFIRIAHVEQESAIRSE